MLLRHLRTARGLYLLGAGASAGEAPFGAGFLRDPAIDFLRHAHSFSTSPQKHTPLSRLVLEAGADIDTTEIDGRSLRPGTDDLSQELLQLMPPSFPRSLLMHQLAVARHRRRVSHNYLPFRFAPPSLFMNYNHDGLATGLIGDLHRVVEVHGSIEPWIGSPEALEFIRTAGIEYGIAIAPDQLVMLEQESYVDQNLSRRLMLMAHYQPEFIAIIGYSFAWTGRCHNDIVSLDCLVDHYRWFPGQVFIVDPQPERLQEVLAERLHGANVVPVTARWNLLAHAYLETLAGRLAGRTLNDYCAELFDAGHGWSAYPLNVE